ESINGLYKAEVIHRKSWKNRAEVELATLTWVDWYNNRRLFTDKTLSRKPGAVHFP
ncbi:integrase core domain-containing protein, partial [Escherichia coli]|uniref:integrase core domain-containing protein n=1 Tax=Escherichia coli TaxID=562 RepID=UPI0022DFF8F8